VVPRRGERLVTEAELRGEIVDLNNVIETLRVELAGEMAKNDSEELKREVLDLRGKINKSSLELIDALAERDNLKIRIEEYVPGSWRSIIALREILNTADWEPQEETVTVDLGACERARDLVAEFDKCRHKWSMVTNAIGENSRDICIDCGAIRSPDECDHDDWLGYGPVRQICSSCGFIRAKKNDPEIGTNEDDGIMV